MPINPQHSEWITKAVYNYFGPSIEAFGHKAYPEGLDPDSNDEVWMMVRQSLPDISEVNDGKYRCLLEADILIHSPNPDKVGGDILQSARLVGQVQSLFDCIPVLKADNTVLGVLQLDADFPNNPNTHNWGTDPVSGITRTAVAGNFIMWF